MNTLHTSQNHMMMKSRQFWWICSQSTDISENFKRSHLPEPITGMYVQVMWLMFYYTLLEYIHNVSHILSVLKPCFVALVAWGLPEMTSRNFLSPPSSSRFLVLSLFYERHKIHDPPPLSTATSFMVDP